jgi:hypothetical protein
MSTPRDLALTTHKVGGVDDKDKAVRRRCALLKCVRHARVTRNVHQLCIATLQATHTTSRVLGNHLPTFTSKHCQTPCIVNARQGRPASSAHLDDSGAGVGLHGRDTPIWQAHVSQRKKHRCLSAAGRAIQEHRAPRFRRKQRPHHHYTCHNVVRLLWQACAQSNAYSKDIQETSCW